MGKVTIRFLCIVLFLEVILAGMWMHSIFYSAGFRVQSSQAGSWVGAMDSFGGCVSVFVSPNQSYIGSRISVENVPNGKLVLMRHNGWQGIVIESSSSAGSTYSVAYWLLMVLVLAPFLIWMLRWKMDRSINKARLACIP